MRRPHVSLRDATPLDAPWLAELWADALRRGSTATRLGDLEQIIDGLGTERRIVVAEYDGTPAGAVYLQVASLTPLDLEPIVEASFPVVLPQMRRRGVGRALMGAAVTFAEERGIQRVATASSSASRDANRFLARLGLGSHSVLRSGNTLAVRARLVATRPPRARRKSDAPAVDRVLAVRRSLRDSQSSPAV